MLTEKAVRGEDVLGGRQFQVQEVQVDQEGLWALVDPLQAHPANIQHDHAKSELIRETAEFSFAGPSPLCDNLLAFGAGSSCIPWDSWWPRGALGGGPKEPPLVF